MKKELKKGEIKGDHGGARPGSGRPGKEGAVTSFKLSAETHRILNEASAGKGKGEKTRIIEEAIRLWDEAKRGAR